MRENIGMVITKVHKNLQKNLGKIENEIMKISIEKVSKRNYSKFLWILLSVIIIVIFIIKYYKYV